MQYEVAILVTVNIFDDFPSVDALDLADLFAL
jgi:hypothetical protein